MKTKLLYVLTCSEKDIYAQQAYISMFSARRHNKDIKITLLTDTLSHSYLNENLKFVLDATDEIVVIDLDKNLSGQYRSRLLKTGARKYIDGDFLFIDCDTIVVGELTKADSLTSDIMAVRDSHTNMMRNPYRGMILEHVKKMGFHIQLEDIYYNSGVIYVKDTPRAHKFYDKWSKNYLIGREKGVIMDQPSFAQTNIELDMEVKPLPDVWNCQMRHGLRYLKDALIVHYLCTNKTVGNEQQLFILNDEKYLRSIGDKGELSNEIISALDNPFSGIAECVDCFAGSDIDFMRTGSAKRLKAYYYGSNKFSIGDKIIINFIRLLSRIF